MSAHVHRSPRARRPALRGAGSALLTLTACIGTLCVVATLAALVFHVKPLVFRSGSMAPDIQTGALALSRTTDASDIKVGDVVSVTDAQGVRVTHRVTSTTVSGDSATLVLKGDANTAVDAEPYVVTSAERVFLDVPRLGYAVAWTTGPAGVFLGGLVVGGVLLMVGSSVVRRDPGGARRASAVAVVLALGAGASTAVGPQQTLAAFTDTATVTSGTLSTYKVPKPVLTATSCVVTGNVLSGFTATITWPAVSTPYTLNDSARIVESNTALTITTAAGSRSVKVTSGLLGSLLGTTVTVRLNSALASSPTWISANADQKLVVGLAGLSLTCGTAT